MQLIAMVFTILQPNSSNPLNLRTVFVKYGYKSGTCKKLSEPLSVNWLTSIAKKWLIYTLKCGNWDAPKDNVVGSVGVHVLLVK